MEPERVRHRVNNLIPKKTGKNKNPPINKNKEVTMQLFESSSTNLICAVCFGINARSCLGCNNVAYCSREHQIQHWGEHQKSCKPMVTVQQDVVLQNLSLPPEERNVNPYTGMYAATRQLNAKDTVLQMQPIMHVAHNKGLPLPPDSVLCLGCNRWYQMSQGYRCTKCKWPVCSEKCETDSCHSKYECKIFQENKLFPPLSPSLFNGDSILALRCFLLKESKPEDYQKLMALEPVVEQFVRHRYCVETDEKIARFLLYNCRLQDTMGLTFSGAMSLLKVIDFCSIWLPERSASLWDNQFCFVSAKYVFPMKVFVAEECSPNCTWSLRYSPELEECSIRLKVSVPIAAGQYLTASFSGMSDFGASFPKRYENSKFNFRCKCRRCVDPTEGKTFFSGVKCFSCEDLEFGYLLPEDPGENNGPWRCYNLSCSKTACGFEVTAEVNKIYTEILASTTSLQALLYILKRYERVKLHRNHFLIMKTTQLCIDLCSGICQHSGLHAMSIKLLNKAKSLTDKLASIYAVIYPWNSITNAKFLFHYQMLHGVAKVRQLLWHIQQTPPNPAFLQPNEFWDILKIQKAATDVLIEESFGSVERENAILMKSVMEDTESLLLLERKDNMIQYETVMGLQKVYSRYCSGYMYSVLPVFEDKDLNELLLFTGPYCT